MFTIEQLREKLKHHDWTHVYSDDFRYWKAGSENIKVIHNMMGELWPEYSEEIKRAWNELAPKCVKFPVGLIKQIEERMLNEDNNPVGQEECKSNS